FWLLSKAKTRLKPVLQTFSGGRDCMNLGIEGRVAMVAAASKGIGKACAIALAEAGCRVSICARRVGELDISRAEIASLGEIMAVTADVTSLDDLEDWYRKTTEKFGPVEILVTNTGGPPVKRFMELTDEEWRSGVDSTLMNVVRLSRLVIPGMQQRKWG